MCQSWRLVFEKPTEILHNSGVSAVSTNYDGFLWVFSTKAVRIRMNSRNSLYNAPAKKSLQQKPLYPGHGQNQNHGFNFWSQFSFFLPVCKEKVVLVSGKVVLVFGFSFAGEKGLGYFRLLYRRAIGIRVKGGHGRRRNSSKKATQ